MIYQEIPELSIDEIKSHISDHDKTKISIGILSASLYCEDEAFATEVCIRHLQSNDEWVVRSALTGLGHIARIHRNANFDVGKIESEITRLGIDKTMEGNVGDLRRDIKVFILKHHGIN